MSARTKSLPALLALLFVVSAFLVAAATPPLKDADQLFDQKNYREAAEAYRGIVEARAEGWRGAAERVVMCNLRLQLYDEAVQAAEDFVKRTAGTPYEARAERLTAHLYMLLPHWGVRSGGVFHRAGGRQGMYLQTYQHDKKHAVAHMERARDLYAKYDGNRAALAALPPEERDNWHTERVEAIFDLANLVARFSIYEDQQQFWYRWWQERDDFLAETAGEDDFEEALPYWEMRRKRPIGLRVAPDGKPIFPRAPDRYAPDLGDDEKILWLLAEARELDDTPNKVHTATSYYRQAMLARKRFGMDRLNAYGGIYYVDGRQPLQEELQEFNPWELADDEALILAGGQIRVVELPEQFDVMGLLRKVAAEYSDSGVADQARYGLGLYYQSRQQYKSALREYEALREIFADSPWAGNAGTQISRIKEPQVQLSQAGVQIPGQPAELQFSYRNLDRVWFVARPIDLASLLKDLHALEGEEQDYWRRHSLLSSWHSYLVMDNKRPLETKFVARYLGPEEIRWAEAVPNDGTHRYAQAATQTPLKDRGAYLVHAYTSPAPGADKGKKALEAIGLGASRAVVVLTDLAFVQKRTDRGNLYYVADAVTGAPVPRADINILEQWSTYDQKTRKSTWHRKLTDLRTDAEGMALMGEAAASNVNLHLIVSAPGGRLAWSGMTYFYRYGPSRLREGLFAYTITDRPVYRPEQTVRFKVWLRQTREGVMENAPNRMISITVYDPRSDKAYETTKRTDDYGGLDGEFKLAGEPPLGVYRIQVHGENYAGGQNFRVEEYKKPEFEVTVEPDKSHARLGEKLTAVIKADYYFGAPVTDATVSYKVFREEYTHSYYPPGRWDWLYGAGYGLSWYSYDWFPWWGSLRCCWSPPPWWWGYHPYSRARELVQQGDARIGEDGTLKVEIDTAPALKNHPDRDHRYVIQADVRDASRRVISGEGDVKVTRQAFYAMIQSDRGYVRPGEETVVTVRCLTPDNQPVQAEGLVTVSRVVFGGPDNAHIEEEELDRWRAETDGSGTLSFRLRHERSDLLKIKFAAPDEWGGMVEGYGLVWIAGRDFDGRFYRFNDLELLTDKRTYQPGEVCHLMVNTRRPDSYVLFAGEVDNGALLDWRLLHLDKGHAIVDIPVKEGDKPNFFVEATTISDVRVHQQAKRICVPPEDKVVTSRSRRTSPSTAPARTPRCA